MRLFLERSFDDVTIAEVAEAADVSVNTVFNYFPTKEELFFGSHETMEHSLARLVQGRKPGEPVVAFLRRHLTETIENSGKKSRDRTDLEHWNGVRRVLLGSPALQVRAVQRARGAGQVAEDALAQALANDTAVEPDDPTPRLVANQVLALYSAVCFEAERRRRLGQRAEVIQEALATTAEIALDLLERGIGRYGLR
jgi:AcrR family transcriptional regulator